MFVRPLTSTLVRSASAHCPLYTSKSEPAKAGQTKKQSQRDRSRPKEPLRLTFARYKAVLCFQLVPSQLHLCAIECISFSKPPRFDALDIAFSTAATLQIKCDTELLVLVISIFHGQCQKRCLPDCTQEKFILDPWVDCETVLQHWASRHFKSSDSCEAHHITRKQAHARPRAAVQCEDSNASCINAP